MKSNTEIERHQCGALKEVGMDAKKQQVESEESRQDHRQDYRQDYRDEQDESREFEVPEEMESWALDDLSDLVPNIFD